MDCITPVRAKDRISLNFRFAVKDVSGLEETLGKISNIETLILSHNSVLCTPNLKTFKRRNIIFSFIVELRFEYSPKLVPSHITVKVLGPLLILATHIRSPACRASDRRGLSRSSRSPTTSFHVFPTLPDATSFRRSGEVFRRPHPHLT